MGKPVTKPMSILRADFIKNLMNLINDSNLPPFVISPIIKDVYRDMELLIQKQLKEETEMYQKQLNS